jgi:anti-sigma factor RsiW
MNCEDLNEALVDLVDGRLDGAGQRTIERHLEGCQNCRALVEDLRSIRAAAFMLDRREPKAETWSKVRSAIATEPVPRGPLMAIGIGRRQQGGVNWPLWLGAAAALVLATVIGLLPLMNRPETPHDDTAREAGGDACAGSHG